VIGEQVPGGRGKDKGLRIKGLRLRAESIGHRSGGGANKSNFHPSQIIYVH